MADIEISTHLFSQAATLMFVGMGFVFAFLGLMIIVIRYLITPLAKIYPDKTTPVNQAKNTSNNQDSAVIAAITSAINQYRNK